MQSSACVETTLIIHPHALLDFYEYNDFLDLVDALLVSAGFEGEFQVASFHPEYQFAGSDCSDAANFTNRSPFPMLHILRESSVARAVASHPNIDGIPETNIRILRELGTANLALRLRQCFNQ